MVDAIGVIVPLSSIRFQEYMEPVTARGFLRSQASCLGFKSKVTREGDIYIHGSLPKLLKGSNVVSLSREELFDALHRIEDGLSVDLENCKLVSVEVGASIKVERSPSQYLMEWSMLSRWGRNSFNSNQSVYFKNKTWEICGYDKGAEVGKGGLPEEYRPYCLRIEYRHSRRLRLFAGRSVSPWALYEASFYLKLVETWMLKYFGIGKLFHPYIPVFPRTLKGLKRVLEVAGTASLSPDTILASIQDEERSGRISRKVATKMRRHLKDLCCVSAIDNPGMFVEEIDRKVQEIAKLEARKVYQETEDQLMSMTNAESMKEELEKIETIVRRILDFEAPQSSKPNAA